jgi:hypothetical protein
VIETLLEILRWDLPGPEIILEDGGCLGLDWDSGDKSVSIHPNGKISWAIVGKGHGTDIVEFRKAMGVS